MLDIKFIRENVELVKKATKDKGFDESVVDKLLVVDKNRRELITESEELSSLRNKYAQARDIENGKLLKPKLQEIEEKLAEIEKDFTDLMLKVPNVSALDVKVGTPDENEVVRQVGEIPKFNFTVRDHLDIGKLTDSIDFEAGSKVAQSGFFYFKNDLALLELALAQYAFTI